MMQLLARFGDDPELGDRYARWVWALSARVSQEIDVFIALVAGLFQEQGREAADAFCEPMCVSVEDILARHQDEGAVAGFLQLVLLQGAKTSTRLAMEKACEEADAKPECAGAGECDGFVACGIPSDIRDQVVSGYRERSARYLVEEECLPFRWHDFMGLDRDDYARAEASTLASLRALVALGADTDALVLISEFLLKWRVELDVPFARIVAAMHMSMSAELAYIVSTYTLRSVSLIDEAERAQRRELAAADELRAALVAAGYEQP